MPWGVSCFISLVRMALAHISLKYRESGGWREKPTQWGCGIGGFGDATRLKPVSTGANSGDPKGLGPMVYPREGPCLWGLTGLYSVISPQNRQEKIQLQREYENSLKETRMAEMLKQEEREIQQQCEKYHHQLGRRNSMVGANPHPMVGTRKFMECTEAPQTYFPSTVICSYVNQSYWQSLSMNKMLKGILDFRKYLTCDWFKKPDFRKI